MNALTESVNKLVLKYKLNDAKVFSIMEDHFTFGIRLNPLIFCCQFTEFPSCCGILILHEFVVWENPAYTEFLKDVIREIEINAFSSYNVSFNRNGPYSAIMITSIDEYINMLFKDCDYQEVHSFVNIKTGNTVKTFIKTINNVEDN